jgi:GTPase
MVLLDMKVKPTAGRIFECELMNLESIDRSIKHKYEPVVISRNIRQSCKIKQSSHNNKLKGNSSVSNLLAKLEEKEAEDEEDSSFRIKGVNNIHLSSPSASTLNSSNYNFNNYTSSFNKKSSALKKEKGKEAFTLKEDESVTVKFEFRNFPEFIEVGDIVIVNEPYMKAFGRISKREQT